jgi:hypothetical protein
MTDAMTRPRELLPAFLGHASPRILIAALALALCARIGLGRFGARDLLPLAALALLWPLQEWLIHVVVLHWRPRRVLGWTLDFSVPRKHRAHHANPADPELVFIPLRSYAYTLPGVALLWWLVTPDAALAATGIAGHLALALHYEWVHYLVHTRWRPRWGPYRALWRNHRLHHYKNEHYWFGVTRLGADRWLGTHPERDAVPTSPTCRTLGVAEPDAA